MLRVAKIVAAALLFSASPTALAQSVGWTISEVSGPVTVESAGGKRAVQRGTVIAPGATLSTGAGARVVVVRGKDFMTVNANSRVRIPAAAESRGVLDVLQDWGNAIFQIEKKPNPHFGVRTPYLAAVVKGTTFSITVTQQGSSLQVVEGAVETSTSDGGARELIRPGIVAVVSAADRYRLTVQGENTRTIDSPLRNVPGPAAAPGVLPAPASSDPETSISANSDPQTEQAVPNTGDTAAGSAEAQMIATTISATPADLGKVTDGLVAGSTGVQVASADIAAVRATTDNLGSATVQKPASRELGDSSETLINKGPSNDAQPGKSDAGTPGKPDDSKPGKPDDSKPGKPDDSKPGKPDDSKPGKPDDSKPDKPDNSGPGKPDDSKPDKPDNSGPGKPDDSKPDKPDNSGPGKPDDSKPDKPDDSKPGKPDDSGPGKPDDSKPGKPDDSKPGKPDDSKPGKPDDSKPDKPDNSGPGKPDDSKPGKPDDSKPGKPDDSKPDKPDNSGPGKPDDSKPDKPDNSGPGKPDDSKPGKLDDSGPGKPDDSKPGKPDDSGPGKPDDSKPGKP